MTAPSPFRRSEPDLVFVLLVALSLAGLSFLIQGHVGLGLRDEGFLWYGVERTRLGEIPLRDFRAYEPGRYFWCAAWMKIFGPGIVALRMASAIFQALGLACGLLAARRAVANRWVLVPLGAVLLLWMVPPWKLFEPSLAMAAVYVGVRLLEHPTPLRHAVAGAFVGFAAFMGRNHGLYTAISLGGLALLAFLKVDRAAIGRKVAFFAAGIGLGCSPLLALLLCTPGFREAFVESVRTYLEQDALNAPLSVPWPWKVPVAGQSIAAIATGWGVGLCFLALPVFLVAAIATALSTRREVFPRAALLAACGFVGAAYAHHAAVRSDFLHLAQAIHPLWIGLLAFPVAFGSASARASTAWIASGSLLFGVAAIGPQSSIARRLAPIRPGLAHVRVEVAGDSISIDGETARLVELVSEVVRTRVGAEEVVWFSSHFASLYPILDRRSPVWDIYPAWKASEEVQARMVRELEIVEWAILADEPAYNPGLALSKTYPRVWRMLTGEFEIVPVQDLPSWIHVLRRRRP